MKLRIDHIAKIEGHASFTADIVNGDVRAAKIKIEEGARLFEGIMQDRKDEEIPEIGSRICGVCPVAHSFAGFKAIEKAYNIEVAETALSLRKLMALGQLINSHALHLFFFSLSDFFGFKSDLQLINAYPEKTNDAVKIRDLGNRLVEIIGGRSVHPLTPCIGGISKAPDIDELKQILNDFQNNLELAVKLGELFVDLKYPEFERKTTFVSFYNPNEYAIYDGQIRVDDKLMRQEEFASLIKEIQKDNDPAKRSYFADKTYMVGALARLNNHGYQLNRYAKELLKKSELKFLVSPNSGLCYNPFYNILAQAIEVVHCFEEAIKILSELIKEDKIEIVETKTQNRTGEGLGAFEAPRGLLFYDVKIKEGIVEKVNIISPTCQNLANLEADLEEFEHMNGFDNLNTDERKEKIKMLIRAYDPCVTCAVH
ncbi:MAG TPA: Ni/Fe hydrogenase subunit alpha [Candidatus Portnoybacteria bacterium]|jgi:sulfhydrogenase subunit alpha|nr:Ni/Fe hydrogenase subunit alpha [Candidatus Portnoybacteria bacterium]MDD5752191.1 Ni/Fe hydrogenase subunit alpha [Candidatus Portnoybacteria bacterium]HOZ16557.1 Ni/Fe hydrogenase subunit alpha [Candidatus Portnoybacteria bacterium]HPH52184.1 Ni/Fe hydrogenase subunit alpha [Candidatus Portnoybacteria bacterium]HPJ80369.1 Ni/Fe hydrogenase subunit alpha [Candidatus Portnoybacteria bacterium]